MSKSFVFVFNLGFFLVYFLENSVDCLKKIGCDFKDQNYFLKERSFVPQFGEKPKAVKFNDDKQVKQFIEDATKIYIEVLQSNNFNAIDPFIQFYDDCKKAIGTNLAKFTQFFLNYEYKFRPRENGLSLAIEILDKISALKEKYPGVENTGFLASSPLGFSMHEIKTYVIPRGNNMKRKVNSLKLINVVAAYKIEVQNKTVLIIFNAAYYFDKPVVLVQRYPEDPLTNNVVYSRDYKYKFDFFSTHADEFLLSAIYSKENDSSVTGFDVIYIGECYCSFMDTTDKRILTLPMKGILKRVNGQVVSGFQIDLINVIAGQPMVIQTFTTDPGQSSANGTVTHDLTLPAQATGDLDKDLGDGGKEQLARVATQIGYKPEEVMEKIRKVYKILSDKSFLATIVQFEATWYEDDASRIEEDTRKGAVINNDIAIGASQK